jgi:hypothetical protein
MGQAACSLTINMDLGVGYEWCVSSLSTNTLEFFFVTLHIHQAN